MGRIIILFNTLIIYSFSFSQNKSGLITYDIKYPNGNENSNWVDINESLKKQSCTAKWIDACN